MRSLRISSSVACACFLLLAGGGLGGCGSVRRPLALMREPVAPPAARAAAYARAVNLKPSDLPYFEAEEDEADSDPARERRTERKLELCIGLGGDQGRPLANVSSPTFAATSLPAYLSIQSTVEVEHDLTEAARAVRLMRSERVVNCLQRVYVPALESLEPGSAEIKRVSISRLRPPLPGVALSYGFRVNALATLTSPTAQLSAYRPAAEVPRSVTLPMHLDLFGFIVDSASVSLSATGMPTPASRILERNLLIRLHSRAVALRP